MSTKATVYCDVCGKAKGEGNNWFKAWKVPDTATPMTTFVLSSGGNDGFETYLDVCSDSCAHTLLDGLLKKRSE